jgi:hypothetical protein
MKYNQLGEECKSRKQEKRKKFIWEEGEFLDSHVFA